LTVGYVGLVEAALDAPLAVGQLPAYLGFHSKSLCAVSPDQSSAPPPSFDMPADLRKDFLGAASISGTGETA
jgi:hypothetical protein